jgi:23S rRNA (adenine2503-C2)-methyltransferase
LWYNNIAMQEIKNLNLEELEQALSGWQEDRFRARQVFSWIYSKGAKDFEAMSDLPQELRNKLKENFYLTSLKLVKKIKSRDGTEKLLFELQDKNLIEAVIIPVEGRVTGCISSQAGCRFKCLFCASGASGFRRNLTCAEILEETLFLKDNSIDKKLTNLVLMGIGEPLDNYDNVLKAIRIMNSKYALNIGARRITISTSGIIPEIERLANERLQIELSVSLHAADDDTRSRLMPINKKYPLKNLVSACRRYAEKTKRQVTFEYILIRNLNSDLQSAKNLSRILTGFECKVNLIPANPIKELDIEPPNKLDILLFQNYLSKSKVKATLRRPRGEDIDAACGQLRLRYEKQ